MGYYINLKDIKINKYKEILKSADLIPSWMILKENLDENFNTIIKLGIYNLDELLIVLKDKSQIQEFSKQSNIPEDYLTVLKRVVNGYLQKPNRIKDFPTISGDIVSKLEMQKIKNTLHLYKHILTNESRKKLASTTRINEVEMLKLAKLTDLSRIRWVNHTFAYVLLEAGFDTAKKVAQADYKEVYIKVKQLNAERKIYNAHIGEIDMKRCVDEAQILDFEVEF